MISIAASGAVSSDSAIAVSLSAGVGVGQVEASIGDADINTTNTGAHAEQDVVVRAVRNAGGDLQAEIQRDIRGRGSAYPFVSKPDSNIDHRRVRTALVYFQGHWQLLSERAALQPGDVVFFDTLPKPGPDHVGIVTAEVSDSGAPLIINNWTDGYTTQKMDLLATVPVTHRFRYVKP